MTRFLPLLLTAMLTGGACASSSPAGPSATPKMTYAECTASAEYPGFTDESGTQYSGGTYAFEYDNGACNVQRP